MHLVLTSVPDSNFATQRLRLWCVWPQQTAPPANNSKNVLVGYAKQTLVTPFSEGKPGYALVSANLTVTNVRICLTVRSVG